MVRQAKLTESQVAEIKRALIDGATFPELAREYGVHRTAIGYIGRGQAWTHVEAALSQEGEG
jgi:hypothetical protein